MVTLMGKDYLPCDIQIYTYVYTFAALTYTVKDALPFPWRYIYHFTKDLKPQSDTFLLEDMSSDWREGISIIDVL